MNYSSNTMLFIIFKSAFIAWAVGPKVKSMAMFHIVVIFSFISIFLLSRWFPNPSPISHAFLKLSFISRSVDPKVRSFAFEFASSVLTLVPIPVLKELDSIATFESFFKGTLIILCFTKSKPSKTIPFVVFPVTIVDKSRLVYLLALPMFVAVWKLTYIDNCFVRTIIDFQNAKTITFTFSKLTIVNKFLFLVFNSFAEFLALTVHKRLPTSEINFALIM